MEAVSTIPRRLFAAVSAALLAAGVAACAMGGSAGGPAGSQSLSPRPFPSCEIVASPIFTAGATMYGSTSRISGLAERMRTVGEGRFGASFAGIVVSEECQRVFVYRVPSAEYDLVLGADVDAAAIVILDAPHSNRELDDWRTRIMADPVRARETLKINSIWPAFDGTCVQIGVSDVDAAREALRQFFPDVPACVEHSEPVVLY